MIGLGSDKNKKDDLTLDAQEAFRASRQGNATAGSVPTPAIPIRQQTRASPAFLRFFNHSDRFTFQWARKEIAVGFLYKFSTVSNRHLQGILQY